MSDARRKYTKQKHKKSAKKLHSILTLNNFSTIYIHKSNCKNTLPHVSTWSWTALKYISLSTACDSWFMMHVAGTDANAATWICATCCCRQARTPYPTCANCQVCAGTQSNNKIPMERICSSRPRSVRVISVKHKMRKSNNTCHAASSALFSLSFASLPHIVLLLKKWFGWASERTLFVRHSVHSLGLHTYILADASSPSCMSSSCVCVLCCAPESIPIILGHSPNYIIKIRLELNVSNQTIKYICE